MPVQCPSSRDNRSRRAVPTCGRRRRQASRALSGSRNKPRAISRNRGRCGPFRQSEHSCQPLTIENGCEKLEQSSIGSHCARRDDKPMIAVSSAAGPHGDNGRLAQLVRAPARQAGGHRFEPCIAHGSYLHLIANVRRPRQNRGFVLRGQSICDSPRHSTCTDCTAFFSPPRFRTAPWQCALA